MKPQKHKNWESYLCLSKECREEFDGILSAIYDFIKENDCEDQTIYPPITKQPMPETVKALKKYFQDLTTWKHFRILHDGTWIFAVLSVNDTFN